MRQRIQITISAGWPQESKGAAQLDVLAERGAIARNLQSAIAALVAGVGDASWLTVSAPEIVDVAAAPGRAKGGEARASALTPERRSEIARAAATARWHK